MAFERNCKNDPKNRRHFETEGKWKILRPFLHQVRWFNTGWHTGDGRILYNNTELLLKENQYI